MLCKGEGVYWDLTTFISPEIHSGSFILFTKGLFPRPQVDMMSQPFTFLATTILAINPQMGFKGGKNHVVLSPYTNPTSIIMKRKKRAVRAKMRIIKM